MSNDRIADGTSLGHTPEVFRQCREMSTDVGLNDLFAALRVDTGWKRLDD